jgi:DNA (cytosine-5)-methyltransferase 1
LSRVPRFLDSKNGLVIDLFAGGGGASTGLEAALGRRVAVAINHSATALAVHEANHPATKHLVTDVFEVDPVDATKGKPVDVLWASPDCTHFSVAKGGKPRSQGIRSLAEVVVQWAAAVRPSVIFVENVREFLTWGPLDAKGYPVKERAGELFKRWKVRLELLGYTVAWKVLDASEYGAPTRRRRLFIVARCDGKPITWPEPTHGPGRAHPFRTAAECIDWSIPCPSIFERKRPLAKKTLARIAAGIRRFVIESPSPFIIPVNHGGGEARCESLHEPLTTVTAARRGHALVTPFVAGCGGRAGEAAPTAGDAPVGTITTKNDRVLVAPTLVQTGYGERAGQRPRHLDLHEPLGTVVAGGAKHALVSAFLAKHFGGVVGTPMGDRVSTITTKDHHSLAAVTLATFRGTAPGQPMAADVREPLPVITAGGIHVAEVRAFLAAYYGSGDVGQDVREPLRTVVTKDRFGLVTIDGVDHVITDIGMRMLEPHELLRAQFGRFAEGYDLSAAKTKSAQVRLIGNSVCPEVAEAVVRANVPTERARSRRAA